MFPSNNSKKAQAYQLIRQGIIAGDLKPGEVYNISKFSTTYGLGITPIREALILLESEGFVRSLARAGFVITTVSTQDVNETFHLRQILEVEAIGLAVERITPADMQILEENNRLEYELSLHPPPDRRLKSHILNKEFHLVIARASGNQRLANLVDHFIDDMERILAADPYDTDPQQHTGILTALQKRDKAAAQEAMRQHLDATRERIYERF